MSTITTTIATTTATTAAPAVAVTASTDVKANDAAQGSAPENVKIAFDVERMSRAGIGMVITGLRKVHDKVGGGVYIRWEENIEESDEKTAVGCIFIASTSAMKRADTLAEVSALVERARNRREHAPVQHYRASNNGGFEKVEHPPARSTIWDYVKQAPVRDRPSRHNPPRRHADTAFSEDEE
jgi:hypothetical protein